MVTKEGSIQAIDLSRNKCILAIYRLSDNEHISDEPAIISSPEGQPTIPMYFAWPKSDDRSRFMGSAAKNQMKQNLNKTFMLMPCFIGKDLENGAEEDI